MEDLYKKQSELYDSVSKLLTNFKKDGAVRKTTEYCKQRPENLELYWTSFKINHQKMERFGVSSDSYFVEDEYEKMRELYNTAKEVIQQTYNELVRKARQMQEEESKQVEGEQETSEASKQAGEADYQGRKAYQQNKPSEENSYIRMTSRGTFSKLDDMLKKQNINFKAFQRCVSNINIDSYQNKWEFEDALKMLQSRWTAIDSLHWEIAGELEGEDIEYELAYSYHENEFNTIKKEINTKLWSVSHREKSTPQMDIPSFSGSFQQWVSFKDLFNEAIHNNPSLSSAQKMQFLKSKVTGEAERIIHHLPISSENYMVCWEILNHCFDNKILIFTSYFNTFLNLPTMQQQSMGQIKRLHDVTKECMHAIQNLSIDISTWDPMLVQILSQKLDSESYGEYIESIKNPRELPVLQEFIDFLESKFTVLETSSRKKQEPNVQKPNFQQFNQASPAKRFNQPSYSGQNYKHPNYLKSFHTSTSSPKYNCPICKTDHVIFHCAKFQEMTSDEKLNTINKHRFCVNCLFDHKGKACFSTKRCRNCSGNHNTLLHDACTKRKQATAGKNINFNQKPNENVSHVSQEDTSEILLSTALVKVAGADGTQHVLRALIDQGSQISIIRESAAQKLGLKRQHCRGVIFGVGEQQNNAKGKLTVTCTSIYNDFTFTANVIIMNSLVKNLPNCSFPKPSWNYIDNLKLADPEFNVSRPIDMLLGANIYSIIMMGGMLKGLEAEQPIAQQTQLGWLLCGNMMKTYQCNVILNNIDEIRKFWEIEDISEETSLSKEDQECVQFYHETTTRRPDGRYEVRLPLKPELINQLGESKPMALAQFHHLENKFNRDSTLASYYKQFINEYIALNHMKPSRRYSIIENYLPHHAIQRPEAVTTQLRVVFNGSAKTSSGLSLNDCMYTGPNLQKDLQSLILKWRLFKYAWTADVEKMYRQIMVNEQDQSYQKIVWRENPNQPIKIYQLSTVTYGTKSAPFLSMMTLQKLASDESQNYPTASKVLENSYYMDDWIYGSHEIIQGQRLISDMHSLLKSGGFLLRKWISNDQALLENLKQEQGSNNNHFSFKTDNMSKTLGLRWSPYKDIFTFKNNVSVESSSIITKRKLLGEISKICYDPLGMIAPLTTMLKLLFQRVWLADLKWDDKVPKDICNDWQKIRAELEQINKFQIPRWIGFRENHLIELHGFSDASQKAYGCVIYARVNCQEKTSVVLVAAKAKLVPQRKTLSLPKLELSGAHLLAKLITKVLKCLEPYKNVQLFCWCDSKVVLGWLQGEPSRWKPFVANRVQSIKEIIPVNSWDYVSTDDNPADAASRGLSVAHLKNHDLWWNGPQWLQNFQRDVNQKETKYTTDQEMKIKQVNFVQKLKQETSIINELLENKSSFQTVTHIIAWIRRALIPTSERKAMPSYLTLSEIRQAKRIIIKQVQKDHFSTDIEQLKQNKEVSSKSILKNLNPFLDQEEILRVGGRLANAELHKDMKHPAIIPHESRLTTLLTEQTHQLTFHGGPRLTLANLRRQYWITGGIRAVKKQIRACIICRKNKPDLQQQLMGDLPAPRSNPERCFYHCGLDYTGYVYVKSNKGRGTKTTKGYIAVFICLVSKAVHLELVSDMTSSAFIAALRRMAARRGAPQHIYSDQGTNFVGANRLLQENYEELQQVFNDSCLAEVTKMNIEWHFNAPSWPSAGGLWERAVRSLKFHLKRVVGEQRLTFEEYSTLLCQVEACLNSRPLCALSEDPDDLSILTPAHFLTGCSELTVVETEHDARTRWHLISKMTKDLWKRWKTEYLSQLSARTKWTKSKENIKVGSLVTIQDENLPPGKWAMGRVIDLHPGKDNLVRVVTLKTKNGIIKRPVVKLSILPLQTEHKDDQTQQYQQNRKTKSKAKGSFSAIVTVLLFFMTMISTSVAQHSIIQLPTNQSLYFDPITKIKIIRDQWNLVVYYNLDPYWTGIEAYDKLATYLNNTCNKIQNQINCNMILLQLKHSYQEIKYYNDLLLNQHFSEHARRRRRRGLIDGVGNIANSLFGVLDSKFAERYARDIHRIKNNERYLKQLWQNQTSVVEAEFNLIKRLEDTIERQHKIIHKRLNSLDTKTNVLQSEITNLSIIQEFTLTALSGNNLLQTLRQLQETLLNTITDIYHGQISLHLLTPTQLKTELQIISSQMSKDLTLPIDNLEFNISTPRKRHE